MTAVGFQINVASCLLGNVCKQLACNRDCAVLTVQNRQAGADFQIKICTGDAQLSFVRGQEHVAKNWDCRSGLDCLCHGRQGMRKLRSVKRYPHGFLLVLVVLGAAGDRAVVGLGC
ncbi:hypothetical protein D3C80_1150990 [compost metagenome]